MKHLASIVLAASITLSAFARAGEPPGSIAWKPHPVCFNVFCRYEDKSSEHGDGDCEAGAVFTKFVTEDGREVPDRSELGSNPRFEVSCNGIPIFNGAGHRFTDRQGTRIQGLTGPYPAILLPRGALADQHRYIESALELRDRTLRGECFIYTGPQLN